MSGNSIDLGKLFEAVTSTLVDNQTKLNKADGYNGDHGDHMVEIFQVITYAMEQKKGQHPADALEYAAQLLRKHSESGSSQLYSAGLSQAASNFKDKEVTQNNVMSLIQDLLGGGQSLEKPVEPQSDDLLGSLLGSLTGGGEQPKADGGLDAGDLLNAGLAFFQSKQSGDSNIEALLDAVVSTSQVSQVDHRAQSGKLVTNALLQAISAMSGR